MELNTYWVLPPKKYCFGLKCLDYITDIKWKINIKIRKQEIDWFVNDVIAHQLQDINFIKKTEATYKSNCYQLLFNFLKVLGKEKYSSGEKN